MRHVREEHNLEEASAHKEHVLFMTDTKYMWLQGLRQLMLETAALAFSPGALVCNLFCVHDGGQCADRFLPVIVFRQSHKNACAKFYGRLMLHVIFPCHRFESC